MKKLAIAALATFGLALTSNVASAQLCPLGIVAKSIYISATEKRELTQKEAFSCGLLYEKPAPKPKKTAKAAKKG
jgi:hypothetical protein